MLLTGAGSTVKPISSIHFLDTTMVALRPTALVKSVILTLAKDVEPLGRPLFLGVSFIWVPLYTREMGVQAFFWLNLDFFHPLKV